MRYLHFWACAAFVATCFGCGGGRGQEKQSDKPTLLLYCGAGIQPPVAELADTFGRENNVEVDTDYAGSETLLSTLKVLKQGDLYMPGDKHYVEQAAALPGFLGAHWFQWRDQQVLGRFDGENYNIGLVDVTNRPHVELVEAAQATHKRLYDVHAGTVAPFAERPQASAAGTPDSPWDR